MPEKHQKEPILLTKICPDMKKKLFICILTPLFISCTSTQEKNTGISTVIDIENSIRHDTGFKVSDFGKTIRYIPLETTDDCLIGNKPIVKVLENYILIESNQRCLLFDKKDGRFISAIGHTGQDPEAYSSSFCWADEKEESLYFTRQPNQLIKYDMKGNFCGKTEFPSPPGLASYYLVTDSGIIGYYNDLNANKKFALARFEKDGTLRDTIPSLLSQTEESLNDILNVSVIKETNTYGNWAKAGVIIINYKNDNKQIIAPNTAALWRNNGHTYFKEIFVDTIYTITNQGLSPALIFNTGKWHWPEKERTHTDGTNARIFITEVSENNLFLFFQCIKGLYSGEPVLYNGLYNKKTGETKIVKNSDAIQDDLTGFMPFKPLTISTSGEFASLIEASDIMEWTEEHPEATNNGRLSFLQHLTEDMNPVIVLVE